MIMKRLTRFILLLVTTVMVSAGCGGSKGPYNPYLDKKASEKPSKIHANERAKRMKEANKASRNQLEDTKKQRIKRENKKWKSLGTKKPWWKFWAK